MDWINAIIQGILLGGLYALLAAGLSLIFGIMRLVNIAHGDLIILAAYLALSTVEAFGMPPLLSVIIVVPAMAALGYVLQRLILNRTLGKDILPPLLVTFGLAVIVQNSLLEIYTADPQNLDAGRLETVSIAVGELAVGLFPLMVFGVAVTVIAGLQWVFYHTKMGRAFRAVSDNQETAQLMGLHKGHVFGQAMALALAVAGLAGVFLAVRTSFDPFIGGARLIFGFEAVIIGGLGSLWGTLVGGIILGVAQGIGAQIHPGYQVLAGHLAFLVILVFFPRGLMPKVHH